MGTLSSTRSLIAGSFLALASLAGCAPSVDSHPRGGSAPLQPTPTQAFKSLEPGEKLMANVMVNYGNATTSYTSEVKNIEDCRNYAAEMAYMASLTDASGRASCTGPDGLSRARFTCSKDKGCVPVRNF